jgi:hypothetical protein
VEGWKAERMEGWDGPGTGRQVDKVDRGERTGNGRGFLSKKILNFASRNLPDSCDFDGCFRGILLVVGDFSR